MSASSPPAPPGGAPGSGAPPSPNHGSFGHLVAPVFPHLHAPHGGRSEAPPPSLSAYLVSVAVLVGGIAVQYLPIFPTSLPYWEGEGLGALITYGPGLLAFFLLVGTQPLRNFVRRSGLGTLEGFRWYGILGLLSILAVIALSAVYEGVEPTRFNELLKRVTNVESSGASDPIAWILLSFPIGLVEETLFRGFVLGGALLLFGTKRWKWHAVWTSLLFTGVHLYYGLTYLEISPLFYVQIFLLGLAFAFAYVRSGGNLLVVALLHGLYDATSFSQFLPWIGLEGAAVLRYAFLGMAAVVALVLYLREKPSGTGAPQGPGAPGPVDTWAPFTWTAGPTPAGGTTFQNPTPSLLAVGPPASLPAPPPLPPPPVVPGVGPPPMGAAPAQPPSFLPTSCPRCGAVALGDVHGPPRRCSHCGASLAFDGTGGPHPMGGPAYPSGLPPPGGGPPSGTPFAPSAAPYSPWGRISPAGPASGGQEGAAFFEGLAPGAWPPPVLRGAVGATARNPLGLLP